MFDGYQECVRHVSWAATYSRSGTQLERDQICKRAVAAGGKICRPCKQPVVDSVTALETVERCQESTKCLKIQKQECVRLISKYIIEVILLKHRDPETEGIYEIFY